MFSWCQISMWEKMPHLRNVLANWTNYRTLYETRSVILHLNPKSIYWDYLICIYLIKHFIKWTFDPRELYAFILWIPFVYWSSHNQVIIFNQPNEFKWQIGLYKVNCNKPQVRAIDSLAPSYMPIKTFTDNVYHL